MAHVPQPRLQADIERAELQAVLASPAFERSSNTTKLLEYVCAKYFDGAAAEVKEYNIALDVFHRSTDFDPRRHSIVRVEAARLRKRLESFYSTEEGRDRPVQLQLPPGSYVPRFVLQERAPAPVAARRRFSPAVAALVLVPLLLALLYALPGKIGPWRMGTAGAASPNSVMAPGPKNTIRILAGYSGAPHVDAEGEVWLPDQYFSGGSPGTLGDEYIDGTMDQAPFHTYRTGSVFSYDLPLDPGVYELRLFFVETQFGPGLREGGGETSRVMHVNANGKPLLTDFDIYADAGGHHIADCRVFKDVSPAADGFLHLLFAARSNDAVVNAIEVRPGTPGKLQPIRIAAQKGPVEYGGNKWMSDRYFRGGRHAKPPEPPLPRLFHGERYGAFSYRIPVTEGKYTVSLYFAETYFKQPGKRLFHVFADGNTLLRNFGTLEQAQGAVRSVVRTFRSVEPDPQGKITLSFVPVVNYGSVNGIEVTPEQ